MAMNESSEKDTFNNKHDENSTDDNTEKPKPSLKNLPWNTLLFCLFLYMAQGIVIGNNIALPILLIDRNWSLLNLSILSQAFLPYSAKVLIAPIVDSYYIKKLGYRKSWICGLFSAGGLLFIVASFFIEDLMAGDGNQWPILGILFTLTATQAIADVAVDAWSICLLSEYDSSLRTIDEISGIRIGQLLSKTVFILLESTDFSNKWIRPFFGWELNHTRGIVTVQNFYILLGSLLLIMAMLAFRKKENLTQDQIFSGNIKEAYTSLWKILKTKNVMIIGAWYSTAIIFIYCGYSIVFTRIQQNGVPRDSLALLDIPIICVKIISPMLIVKLMLRDKILDIYRYTYFLQIVFCFLGAGIVYLSSTDIWTEDPERSVGKAFPTWFYVLIFFYQSVNYGLLAAWSGCSTGGFVNRIVDQRIAGTYITAVMCFNNFGYRLFSTIVMPLVDVFSVYNCAPKHNFEKMEGINGTAYLGSVINGTACVAKCGQLCIENQMDLESTDWNDASLKNCCKSDEVGGKWVVEKEGFYVLCFTFGAVGFVYWWFLVTKVLVYLENRPKESWKVKNLYDEKKHAVL